MGKSCLLERFSSGLFSTGITPSVGVDFRQKMFRIRDYNTKLIVWDTPGKDSFDLSASSIYNGAHAIFICFDLSDSFGDVSNWLTDVIKHGSTDSVRYLVGCKGDTMHQVPEIAAKNLAAKYGCEYFEVSAKSGREVENLFSSTLVRIFDLFIDKNKRMYMAGASSLFNQKNINGIYLARATNSDQSTLGRTIYYNVTSPSTELLYDKDHWVIKKRSRWLATVPSQPYMLPCDPALQGQWSENAGAIFTRPFSQPALACSLLEGSTRKDEVVAIADEPIISTEPV